MDAAKNKKAGARSAKKKKGLAYEIRKALKIGKSDYYDFNLVAVIILIMCFGLIMLYSTSSYMAQINEGDDMFYFKKQALYSIGCLVMAIIESYFDYHLLQKIPMLIYFAAVVLMVLVKTPLGVTSHGARRWLKLGVQFQPAEVAKIAVIICLSYLIVKMGKRVKTLKASMVLLGVGGFQAFLAYWLTQNLSTAIIIFGITVGLVFIAHPKTKPFILVAAVGVVLAAILVYVVSRMDVVEGSFRLRRIQVWLHPEADASGDGYQTLQALYAIGSGGLFGKGLGASVQKLGYVPEAQNDFIFTIICEELGLFGAICVILLFILLIWRCMVIANSAPDLYASLIAVGVMGHIALQVVLNICVVTNWMPNTGIILPFISYGGTSVAILLSEMGLVLNVSRQIRFDAAHPIE